MIGLFFEVTPLEKHAENYFNLAALLRPELERSGGVEFIDRYRSIDRPGIIFSHQWWADEEALVRWRQHTHELVWSSGTSFLLQGSIVDRFSLRAREQSRAK